MMHKVNGAGLLTAGKRSYDEEGFCPRGNRIGERGIWRLMVDLCQRSQMGQKLDSNHSRVWTSTDRTAGRSRTMSAQLSPPSADAYTWPPVVPKYTPHESSESTAMASRNTLT